MNQTNAMELANDNDLGDSQRTLKVAEPMMQGSDVTQLQQQLMSLGFSLPQYGADGKYGPETESAVVAFQQKNNLQPTGIVNGKTWDALNKAGSMPANLSSMAGMGVLNPLNWGVALQEGKTEFWDPLPASQKLLYGGGTAALLTGVGYMVLNDNF